VRTKIPEILFIAITLSENYLASVVRSIAHSASEMEVPWKLPFVTTCTVC